ncbi:MAG: hypothetical protein QM765_17640 [Myxococcales bacterium]
MRLPLRLLSAFGVAGMLATLGCDHQVISPAITPDPEGKPGQPGPVAPDLVCAEQLSTPLTLSGDGFTPFPTETLQPTVKLLLPTVQLNRTRAIDGTAASGSVTVPDDVDDPSHSHVRWFSEEKMGFDVYPALALDPGLYSVTVTNRDGIHSAEFPNAFAAVPRPTITRVAPDVLCVAQEDRQVTLTGTGFLDVGGALPTVRFQEKDFAIQSVDGCIEVPGPHSAGVVRTCTSATFTIPRGACQPSEPPRPEALTLTNPASAACTSTDIATITLVPPPTVQSIVPDLVCDAQGNQPMVVNGTRFLQIGAALPIVTVGGKSYSAASAEGCEPIAGTFNEGTISTCTLLKFTIRQGDLPEGDHAIVVTNPPPADCSSSELVNLHVAPPPTITGLGQAGICTAQADQTVTVQGNDFLQIGGELPKVTIDGVAYTPTAATGCTAIPGTFAEGSVQSCTGLTIVVPQGALAAGSYPVTVTNPAPAGCTTAGATVTLEVVPPPTVTGIAPASICSNGGTLTITGTDFGPVPTVTLTLAGFPDVTATNVSVNAAGTAITATFPSGAEADQDYTLVVNNGCDDPAPHKTVHVVPGPKLFFADPEVVYNGISTRVTLYVTSLNLPLKSVSLTPSGGGAPIELASTVDASGRKVQVIIPADLDPATDGDQPVPPGEYDLSLADQVDCPAQLAKAIRVTDSLTLSLRSVVPPFGWKAPTPTSPSTATPPRRRRSPPCLACS